MKIAFFLFLVVAQAFWAGCAGNDPHGVQVQQLDSDVDYRDFNETAELMTEASTKATQEQNNGSIEHQAKNGSDNGVAMSVEHHVSPKRNIDFEFHEDFNDFDCSEQNYRSILEFICFHYKFVMVLFLGGGICLIVLATLRTRLTPIRGWGYSLASMEDSGYELRLIRIRTRPIRPNPPNII